MKVWKFTSTALSLGIMLSLTLLVGCGGGGATPSGPSPEKDKDGGGTKDGGSGETKTKQALKSGKAIIKGKVVFDGDMPDVAKLNEELATLVKEKAAPDKDHCLSPKAGDDATEQMWKINKDNKGLKNVVVFLVPETGTFFACAPDDAGVKEVKDRALELHQPYCAFEPHVGVLFPEYRDDKNKKQKTGEKVVVFNDTDKAEGGKKGGISHNTKWSGGSGQSEGNATINTGDKKEITDAVPSKSPMNFACSIHPWMNASIWVLDHPYFAVTDANGEFEIKNAPVGPVKIVAWHEAAAGNYLNSGGNSGEAITLKDGENKKDFKAKK